MERGDDISAQPEQRLSRRRFLALAAAGLGGWLAGRGSAAWAGFDAVLDDPDLWARPRYLDLLRVGTGERVSVCYWADGELRDGGYERICHILRDVRVNRSTRMDPALLDKLWASQGVATGHAIQRPLEILSAYRTRATNRQVGGARASLHTTGQAVDFRIPGIRPSVLARVLRGFDVGGVGFYGRWVHADTGDPRAWRG